jgi:hypothetical protein
VKFKLDENLPASSASALISSGHDVDTVTDEGLAGAPDTEVVAAATAAARILISLDRGTHAGIIVLRLRDQSAVAVTKAIGDLAHVPGLPLACWRNHAHQVAVAKTGSVTARRSSSRLSVIAELMSAR